MSKLPYRGSEWKKWDLHIHTPFTKLNNKYSAAKGGDVLTEFCDKVMCITESCTNI